MKKVVFIILVLLLVMISCTVSRIEPIQEDENIRFKTIYYQTDAFDSVMIIKDIITGKQYIRFSDSTGIFVLELEE